MTSESLQSVDIYGEVRLPKRITPCPISESICEVRFESGLPSEAIFGLIYDKFRTAYPKMERQPILNIPAALRAQDPNLKYLPEYRLDSSDNFQLLIGQRTFAVANIKEYSGWHIFSNKILDAFGKIREAEIITKVTRVGLRYVNTFDRKIIDISTLRLTRRGEDLPNSSAHIIAQIPSGEFTHTLQVANNVEIRQTNRRFVGSVIDIDTWRDQPSQNFFSSPENILNEAHDKEKKLFFGLLTDEYTRSLNPEY